MWGVVALLDVELEADAVVMAAVVVVVVGIAEIEVEVEVEVEIEVEVRGLVLMAEFRASSGLRRLGLRAILCGMVGGYGSCGMCWRRSKVDG